MKRNPFHFIYITSFIAALSLLFSFTSDIQAQTGYPVIDTTDLHAYYDFAGSFRDSTGNNVSAVASDAELTDDRFCHPLQAVNLTKTSSWLEVDDHPSLDFSDSMSISFRVYLDSLPETETRIISKSDPAKPDSGSYWITIYPGEEIVYGTAWSFSFTDTDGNIQTFMCDWGMITKNWIYYTVTFDGNRVVLYLGSEPCAEFDISPTTIKTNDDPLWFGNSVGSGITGKLDDILLYERVIQFEELESIRVQSVLWPDTERPNIGTCIGDTIELVSKASGPFLDYTFMKDGEVIQQGPDSICRVRILTETDFGEYSCIASNCQDQSTKYFDVELSITEGNLVVQDLTLDIQAYGNAWVDLSIDVTGWEIPPAYQWYLNEYPVGDDSSVLQIAGLSASDTGYYYCETTSLCNMILSDSIHVTILPSDQSPAVDTSLLKAYYPFHGNYTDSTGNTGPAINYSVQLDTGLFNLPGQAARFTGVSSYLEIPDDPDLDIADQLTIAFALRVDSIPEDWEPVMSKASESIDTIGNYSLFVDSNLHLIFSVTGEDGGVRENISDSTLQPGVWHLISATFDGSEIDVYIDGSPNTPLSVGNILLRTNDDPLIIGSQAVTDLAFSMSELMIFHRVLGEEEIRQFHELHLPGVAFSSLNEAACIGDTVELNSGIWGPFMNYSFSKDGVVLQEGSSPTFKIPVNSHEEYGEYLCDASNGYRSVESTMLLESGRLYDDLVVEYQSSPEIQLTVGDTLDLEFYVNHDYEDLDYEMYHNGTLLPAAGKQYAVDSVTLADAGAYYLVLINGCERIISDTVVVNVERIYYSYEVAGWDWTAQISGTANSYFSSISTGKDSSFHLLGHFGEGLRIEDTEAFSAGEDDIFIVKYSRNGDYQWSKFLTSAYYKGKGDLAVDREGNIYVSGSFWDTIHIEDQVLTTDRVAGSGYLSKYNPSGMLLWIKELETTRGVSCDNIEIDSADHIYLGGNFSGALTIDAIEVSGTGDSYANVMFVARMDTAGNCEWISHAVTDPDMGLFGLVDLDLGPSGQVLAAGTYNDMVDFGNGVILSTPIEAPFLVQFDGSGVAQWGTTITPGPGFAETFDVSADDMGRIFMTGMHLGDIGFGEFSVHKDGTVMEEIFLARFDSAGICTALKSFGSKGDGGDFGVCYEPATDTTGYLLGMYGDTLVLGQDTLVARPASGAGGVSPNMFIAKLTDEGEPLVMKSAGVRGNQFFGEIAVTEEGRLYFAGLNEGVTFKKAAAAESNPLAFVGFLEEGIPEPVKPEDIVVITRDTICQGDSTLFRGAWYSAAGTYNDRVVVTYGSDTVYTLELDTRVCTSVEQDMAGENYMIYPIPARQILYVKSSDQEPFGIQMFELSGRLIMQKQEQSEYSIDVQGYEPGIYFLKLTRPGENRIHKVMIE